MSNYLSASPPPPPPRRSVAAPEPRQRSTRRLSSARVRAAARAWVHHRGVFSVPLVEDAALHEGVGYIRFEHLVKLAPF